MVAVVDADVVPEVAVVDGGDVALVVVWVVPVVVVGVVAVVDSDVVPVVAVVDGGDVALVVV